MTTIEFVTVEDEQLVGRVVFDGGQLAADPPLRDLVEAFLSGQPAAEFEETYDGWSNGYISARKVMATKLRPVTDRDAALKQHLKTTHFVDTESGQLSEPQSPPVDATSGEDDGDDKSARFTAE